MKSSIDLQTIEPMDLTDDPDDDVAWLGGELADASPGRESDNARGYFCE